MLIKKLNENKELFTNLLTESNLNVYNSLSDSEKENIKTTFNNTKIYTPTQANLLLTESLSILDDNKEVKLNWLIDMPSKYIATWNALNENQKMQSNLKHQ